MSKEELKVFKEYKKNYHFTQREILLINDMPYCDGISLLDESGKKIGESEKWIDCGFTNSGALPKCLSNLFPYTFSFRGKTLHSIESFFQGIKFKDISLQNLVFEYSGLPSNYIKACSDYDWKESGYVFFQGQKISRYSNEYYDLIDELYICAIQNPLYRQALLNCNKPVIHSIGKEEQSETLFTRYEFELQLNCLIDFLHKKNTH